MSSKKLEQKLLNVSNDDPCINSKKRSSLIIDLKEYVSESDLEKFLWSKKQELIISKCDFNDIKNDLQKIKNASDFIEYCFSKSISLNKTNQKLLEKDFGKAKLKVINDIFKKEFTVAKVFQKFQSRAKMIEREENIYTLYVASGYINGRDITDGYLNAPLLIWEVSIDIKGGTVYLIKNDDEPTVNEKLNYYLNLNYGLKINDDKFKHINDIKLYKKYLQSIVDINFESSFSEFKNAGDASLTFLNAATLSIIEPLGGVIKKDVEYINKKNFNPLSINDKVINYNDLQQKWLKNEDLLELNHPTNLYQRFAIKSALSMNTLIYGPPGTGKSETIATLIANIIHDDKSILMVSEKMAALEVLEKRLGEISKISLFAFKPEHKDKFYNSLINIDKILKSEIVDPKEEFKNNAKIINSAYEKLINQLQTLSKNKRIMEEEFNIFDYINEVDAINVSEYDQKINEWFNDLLNYHTNKKNIFDIYENLIKIQKFITSREDATLTLSKYDFEANKIEINEFLDYFNNNQHEQWLLKNFIKQKKDYKKKSTFQLGSVKNEIAIVKLFEDYINEDFDNVKFKNIEFLLNIPYQIRSESDYKKYLMYYIIKNNLSNINNDLIQNLIDEYIKVHTDIAIKNSSLVTNHFLFDLKQKMQKNKKLAADINKIVSFAFAKHKPNINHLIKENYDILRTIFPIWVLSPNQTCILTPCKKNIFDYGIFDEASQMFTERAVPLLFRCSINIVAGDDKQLQPTSFFMKKFEDEQEDELSSYSIGSSLFEQASICMWSKFYLKNHYRSDSAKLIQFSNDHVYENNLEFSSKNIKLENPIEVHNVKGIWKYRYNQVEIDEIIKIIPQIAKQNKSILIVTFNQQQANVLENDFLDEFGTGNIYNMYKNELIKIRSLENVQGDEADVVILSISYARDTSGKLRNFFGPISQSGGINRLNVAITRAKEKMIVVKSLDASDIKNSENENNNIFKLFIKYVDDCSKNKISSETNQKNSNHLISNIYESLNEIIDKSKYEIISDYNIGKYNIDIAIINKKTKTVSTSVMINRCDFKKENIINTNETINREIFIKDLRYNPYWVDIIQWFSSKEKILKEIINKLN